MSKNIIIALIVVILLLGGALYYVFYGQQKEAPQPQVTPLDQEEQGLGAELYEKSANPAQKVPETNPFKQVETNPLQGTNPFEGAYTNPFE